MLQTSCILLGFECRGLVAYPSDLKHNVAFLLHTLILIEPGEDSSSGSLSPPPDGSLNDWEFLPQNHLTTGRSSGINAKKV